MFSKVCNNVLCSSTSTVEWKKGWPLRSGHLADLCYRCGTAYENSTFCETFHSDQDGWRECYLCNKRLHCGCIASKAIVQLMDYGGVGCMSCGTCHQLNSNKSEESLHCHCHIQHHTEISNYGDRSHLKGVNQQIKPPFSVPARNATSIDSTEEENQTGNAKETDGENKGNQEVFLKKDDPKVTALVQQSELLSSLAHKVNSDSTEQSMENARIGVLARLPMKTLANRQHVNGEIEMNIDGGRNEADIFSQPPQRADSQPLVIGGDKREEFLTQRGFGKLLKSDHTTSYRPYSTSFSTEVVEGKKQIGASQSPMFHCSASSILQKPSKLALSTPPGISKSAQARIGRPPVEGRGKGHLLPRYWPKYTDKEVQQISGNLNLNIVPLFEKTLSASDAGRIGRLVLPKACAEAYFPPISQSEGIPLKIQDVKGKEWTFQFRFWPNNNSRMYVLEGVTPCIQSMMLQAGDTVTFSRVDPGGKLVMGSRKAANAGDMQGCGLTNSTSNKNTSSCGVTETLPSINASSHISKDLKGMSENLSSPCGGSSSKKSENNGGMICDDLPRVKEKKKARTIGTKNKRLVLHSEESMELKLTWKETQELLRPSPSAKPSIVVIEEHEFEEFDEPPVFGKRTIITSRPSGGQERWASCDDCSKWRRLPVDALLPFKWTCSDNVWDGTRCSCSAPEESLKGLENVLKVEREYKKRRTEESQAAKTEQEPSGLDALASAAVFGDTLGEPEVATTTRHPRHRVGCSCIVCIQPPSGKGKHKPNCGCNVCSTVKRRFKTLMMRRKKKQLEREGPSAEDEVNKSTAEKEGKIDLNSDPYNNREDTEAVMVEKDESSKREVVAQGGDSIGVNEVEGEAAKINEEPRISS